MQRGLDPAGMLAVGETRRDVEDLAEGAGADIRAVEDLTKALHVGAVWDKADELSRAESPEVRAWMLLADETNEINDRDLSADEYLKDVDRIKSDLVALKEDPQAALDAAAARVLAKAKEKFTVKDGVPFSEDDAFLYMAVAGKKYGVCQAGELYFAGAGQLDYGLLEEEGLTPVEREDRGRLATFFQRQGQDVVKKLYPGLAIVFGDEELARRLARSAEKFVE